MDSGYARPIRRLVLDAVQDREEQRGMDDVAAKVIDILRKNMKEPPESISPETRLTELEIEFLDLAALNPHVSITQYVILMVAWRRCCGHALPLLKGRVE